MSPPSTLFTTPAARPPTRTLDVLMAILSPVSRWVRRRGQYEKSRGPSLRSGQTPGEWASGSDWGELSLATESPRRDQRDDQAHRERLDEGEQHVHHRVLVHHDPLLDLLDLGCRGA